MTSQPPAPSNGEKCVVTLSFDNFGESFDLLRHGYAGGASADGVYATRRGVPRILDLLERYSIPASFFVEGWNAQKYPSLVREVIDRGHEVGTHGWMHEEWNTLDENVERDLVQRATDAIESASGQRPEGWRSPGGLITPNTLGILAENGYSYDSSFGDEDVPYKMMVDTNELVEIPWCWSLDDAMFYSPKRPIANPDDVAAQWISAFEAASQMAGYFILVCHPRYSGKPSRLLALERVINHILESGKATFQTCGCVAEQALTKANTPEYPVPEVFDRSN